MKNPFNSSTDHKAGKKTEDQSPLPGHTTNWAEYLRSAFDRIVDKHGLPVSGKLAYEAGINMDPWQDAKDYIEGILSPQFRIIDTDFDQKCLAAKSQLCLQEASVKKQIDDINLQLDPGAEKSRLKQMNIEIAAMESKEKEFESLAFPEKDAKKIMDKSLKNFEATSSKYSGTMTDEEVMSLALQQKQLLISSELIMAHLKKILTSIGSARQGMMHPPKLKYVRFFYFVCFLLLIAETGLSMTVIHDYMNTYHSWSNTMFSYFYSVGMSAAFATLLKQLIDRMLFVADPHPTPFVVVIIVFFGVLLILFGYDKHAQHFYWWRGLVLGFFSLAFALANAFLFREASHLHHLYVKLGGDGQLRDLKKKRDSFLTDKEQQLITLEATQATIKQQQADLDQIINGVKKMIADLKTLLENSFLRGHHDRLAKAINQNEELNMVMLAKLNKYFSSN